MVLRASISAARPYTSLSITFILWKLLLLAIAILTPGPGYDASTHQLLDLDREGVSFLAQPLTHIASKLTRWDAIYYVSIARRGYVYEQEWAFSWAWTHLIRLVATPFVDRAQDSLVKEALVGIVLAHVAHYASVLVLYQLALRLTEATSIHKHRLALTTAMLHILCPAGLFMSAPYAEALTSLLSFLGILLYTQKSPLSTIWSGLVLGLASMVRSNIILHASIYLWDVFGRGLPRLFRMWQGRHEKHAKELQLALMATIADLAASIVAGLLVAVGFAVPQVIAYFTWCVPFDTTNRREWCDSMPPSILSYVQKHYWNNGFLKYWTVSNLPLFCLAAPMLSIMIWSAVHTLRLPLRGQNAKGSQQRAQKGIKIASGSTSLQQIRIVSQLKVIAVPQLLLALLALTNLHVQIITRLATAYPLLYLWLASNVQSPGQTSPDLPLWSVRANRLAQGVVRLTVMYAVIQGGLFASFLPPA